MATMSNVPHPPSTSSITRSRNQKTVHGTVYSEQCELPTEKYIICCMMYVLRLDRAGKALRIPQEAATLMTNALVEHWHFSNVYTVGERHTVKKIIICPLQ